MQFAELQKQLIAAMKARDSVKKQAVSAIISNAKKTAIDNGVRDNITEDIVDGAISKELKTAKEQLETCPADRTDLKEEYQKYYDAVAAFAPKQLSEDEVRAIISEKFADVLATKNRVQIMKAVMGELKGKADGKLINKVVGDLLK